MKPRVYKSCENDKQTNRIELRIQYLQAVVLSTSTEQTSQNWFHCVSGLAPDSSLKGFVCLWLTTNLTVRAFPSDIPSIKLQFLKRSDVLP